MEAYGRYDFNATANDELSFQKGAVLKVNSLFLEIEMTKKNTLFFNRFSTLKKI